ncbi:hypothetical protein, variant [Aphanomyces astaci]|uniref:RanBP2-type domain-containing protein n=1 Tax=Aphanomyces astaci TaxID=112090 RepID=W4H4C9_APHAT|nr:hypothetical protein, variant [Aphanomyces astaci]ETV86099.1 hypothetical protein, variant [Aphanomyces astaci]|eukprot:XP_009824571.1 hypothetical protein, variant [Aphanomyces astaci]
MDSLTDHRRRSDDTAVAIINAKWLTSTIRPIQEPTNEAGVHENSPGGYTCPSSVASDGSNEAGAPPHAVKSEEAPGFHPIDVDQEMEAPSFQLLNFAAHVAAPVPLFDQAIPADRSGDMVEPTSMPGDSQGAPPSFSLLSSLRTGLPPSDYSLPRPAEFQEDRGVVWVDDGGGAPRRQLMHPTASLDSDHCSSTLQRDRMPSHSSQSSSTHSDLAMRQAGLDDSSDEEEIKPRKQLRGNRVSIQSAEWTCKWCTYANEGDGASNECDCCGQAKGSSLGLPRTTHTTSKATTKTRSTRPINMDENESNIYPSGNEQGGTGAGWLCNMCTYENCTNPVRCELCDTPKGSNMPSQSEIREFNHFDDLDDDDDFEVYASDATNNPPDVVDLTAASDGNRQPLYDNQSDSIEEISDTERRPRSPTSSWHTTTELREFTSFTPVSLLRHQADSIDYLNMFGANRSYSDRLQTRVSESRRRQAAQARGGGGGGQPKSSGKRKKGAKKGRKSPAKAPKEYASNRSSVPQFQRASAAGKRRAMPPFQKASAATSSSSSTSGAPRLVNANLQPKARTNSMRVVAEEGDFGAFRSARHHAADSSRLAAAAWEGQGSMRYEDD